MELTSVNLTSVTIDVCMGLQLAGVNFQAHGLSGPLPPQASHASHVPHLLPADPQISSESTLRIAGHCFMQTTLLIREKQLPTLLVTSPVSRLTTSSSAFLSQPAPIGDARLYRQQRFPTGSLLPVIPHIPSLMVSR